MRWRIKPMPLSTLSPSGRMRRTRPGTMAGCSHSVTATSVRPLPAAWLRPAWPLTAVPRRATGARLMPKACAAWWRWPITISRESAQLLRHAAPGAGLRLRRRFGKGRSKEAGDLVHRLGHGVGIRLAVFLKAVTDIGIEHDLRRYAALLQG